MRSVAAGVGRSFFFPTMEKNGHIANSIHILKAVDGSGRSIEQLANSYHDVWMCSYVLLIFKVEKKPTL